MAWFRRQKDASTNVVEAPPEASTVARDADSDDGIIRQERAATGDWMTMPAMATNGPIQPTFRVQTLPEILTSHHSPRVSGSLGHAISADGPSGVASGLTRQSGSNRAAVGVSNDLTLRTPHLTPPVEEFAPLARPLPTVSAEPLAVARLPEPAISHTLGNPLPLAAPAPGVRDLPVARVIDAPVAPTGPAPLAAIEAAERRDSPSTGSSESPYATDGPRVGGFDLSALDTPDDESDPELLASRPDDLAPPIQPRTLQRRTVGARPIEVPPHLLAPSTPPGSSVSAPALDLPLHETRRPSSLDGESPSSDPPAPTTVPLLGVGPTTSDAVGHAPAHTSPPHPVEEGSGLEAASIAPAAAAAAVAAASEAASVAPASEPSLQRQRDTPGIATTAPLAGGAPLPVASGAADHPAGGDGTGRPHGDTSRLPLVSPRPAATPASATPASAAPATAEPPTVNVSRSVDPSASAPTSASEVSVPLPASDAEATTAPAEDPAPTLGALSTSAGSAPLTSSGNSTNDQIGSSPSALPLAPSDWQETLDAPHSGPAAGETTFSSTASSPFLPLAATRAIGATTPLSSFTSLTPSTTSPLQRRAAADAAPTATVQTLARALPTTRSSNRPEATLRTPQPELPPLVTATTLLGTPFRAPVQSGLGASDAGVSPVASTTSSDDPPDVLPLQRALHGIGPVTAATAGSGGADAMPLHTPAASMPSAADIVVSAGLAERGPDGTLLYPQPPPSAASVQRSVEVHAPAESAPVAEIAISRELDTSAPSDAPSQTLQDRSADLAEQARKLYPHIRSQLESDIRKQLEARNRANRFRA